ncbi:MAG: hypothetical protein NUV34_01090 [Sulfuricaulis sp.]|nr:hypothetical protein [Sulfuricaulis sp.]
MGLGDEIMVSGRARMLQQADPRKCRVTYQGKPRWSPIFDGNPRIAGISERGDFQDLPARGANNMRPYHTAKTAERWHYNLDFRPEVGELYFTDAERAFGARFAGRIIIEPHIKPGASPNKQWGWMRWNKLAWLMQRAGLLVTQLGPPGTALLEGAEHIPTPSFRLAAAVLAGAQAAVLPEGGAHHAAAALGVPAVVIFGGFTPVELTGYPMHRNLGASLGEACGMRLPCPHCAAKMASITPEQVFDELRAILKRKKDAA